MNIYGKSLIYVGLAVAAFAHDGGQPDPLAPGPRYGQSAMIGGGSVQTYAMLGTSKDAATGRKPPVEMGVEIPRGTLFGLPNEGAVAVLDFPIQARDTAVSYMMLDWNPQGHEPAGIYDLPHFDFHFYMQDIEDVMAIRPGSCSGLNCDDFAMAMKPVPAQFAPQGYINVGSVVPFMGNHLIDPTSPEFNGKKFTRTFLYGAYDGKLTFLEPMITIDSIVQTPASAPQCSDIKQPQQFAQSAYYPRKYCTAYDANRLVYKVYVTDFVYRSAPAGTVQ
jgi:hypothetical protein